MFICFLYFILFGGGVVFVFLDVLCNLECSNLFFFSPIIFLSCNFFFLKRWVKQGTDTMPPNILVFDKQTCSHETGDTREEGFSPEGGEVLHNDDCMYMTP